MGHDKIDDFVQSPTYYFGYIEGFAPQNLATSYALSACYEQVPFLLSQRNQFNVTNILR